MQLGGYSLGEGGGGSLDEGGVESWFFFPAASIQLSAYVKHEQDMKFNLF